MLSGRIAPASVNPLTLESPYDHLVRLRCEGKDDPTIISTIGFQPYNTSLMAAESIGAQEDPGTYIKLVETIAARVMSGVELEKYAKKLIRGEEIPVDAAHAQLVRLEEERMSFERGDQVEPEENIWMPTFWQAWDEYFGGVPKYGLVLIGAPPGCLTGDTFVTVNRAGKSFTLHLEDLVHRFNGGSAGNKTWNPMIPTMVRSRYPDGTIRLNQLGRAIYSGKKEAFELILSDGKRITGTWDHPILTPNGWVKLTELQPGNEVYVDGGQQNIGRTQKQDYPTIEGLRYHPFAGKKQSNRWSVPTHRLIIDAITNLIDLDQLVEICRYSPERAAQLEFVDPKKYAVHHIDGNAHNNSVANLQVMTHEAHRHLHTRDWTGNVLYHTSIATVVSVEPKGIQDTYDLSLVDEPRNFIANGIVVHNTGKTTALIKLMDCITRNKRKFLFLSLELTSELVMMRWMEIHPDLKDRQRARLIVGDEVYTVEEAVVAITREVTKDPDIYAIGIDFADLMVPEQIGEEVGEASKIYRMLATCAKRIKKPIFLLAQLNSSYTGGIPHVNHFRYSRLAEAMGVMIVMIYNPDGIYIDMGRDDKKNPLTYREGKAYLILGKSRFGFTNGGPGAIAVDFLGRLGWGDEGDGWVRL